MTEEEVFVRAYCAAMAAITSNPKPYIGRTDTWAEDRGIIRRTAIDLADDAVAAWRERYPVLPRCQARKNQQGPCTLHEGHEGPCHWIW